MSKGKSASTTPGVTEMFDQISVKRQPRSEMARPENNNNVHGEETSSK